MNDSGVSVALSALYNARVIFSCRNCKNCRNCINARPGNYKGRPEPKIEKQYAPGDLNAFFGLVRRKSKTFNAEAPEAICAGFNGSDAEAVGKKNADLIRNSPSHWSYVGSSKFSYTGIGVAIEPVQLMDGTGA